MNWVKKRKRRRDWGIYFAGPDGLDGRQAIWSGPGSSVERLPNLAGTCLMWKGWHDSRAGGISLLPDSAGRLLFLAGAAASSQPSSAVWTGELFLENQPRVCFFSSSNNIVSHWIPCNKSLSVQRHSFFALSLTLTKAKGWKLLYNWQNDLLLCRSLEYSGTLIFMKYHILYCLGDPVSNKSMCSCNNL